MKWNEIMRWMYLEFNHRPTSEELEQAIDYVMANCNGWYFVWLSKEVKGEG